MSTHRSMSPEFKRDLSPTVSYRAVNKNEGHGHRDQAVPANLRFARALTASLAPSITSPLFAQFQDELDKLAPLRAEYTHPKRSDVWPEGQKEWVEANGKLTHRDQDECVYLAGNSLGLMPRRTQGLIAEELQVWGKMGVLGHTQHAFGRPWIEIDNIVTSTLAEIVGAKPAEVACMGTLTANLHLLLNSFYKPTPHRHKIMYEGKAFPSDSYAFASQIEMHGYPASSLLPVFPRPGEYVIRTEDILEIIAEQGDSIAVICFGAVQYYSGEWFEMKTITEAGHAKGCYVGFDCAHAVGNVPLELHDWNIDFACWCSYKYLNAGPGGIAGIFVHEDASDRRRSVFELSLDKLATTDADSIRAFRRLSGWWGHELTTRFAMPHDFKPIPGAAGFQLSNPSVLDVISLYASLSTFRLAGAILPQSLSGGHTSKRPPILAALREKSLDLTYYLELLLKQSKYYSPVDKISSTSPDKISFTIITPSEPGRRGAQLSLLFHPEEVMMPIFDSLREKGVLGDERKPGVIRIAPAPMYSSWMDCYEAYTALEESMDEYPERAARRLARQVAALAV